MAAPELDDIFAAKIGDEPEPDEVNEGEPDEAAAEADQDDAPSGTDPTPAEERLYAGKFKDVDALEKSYLEAERRMHELSQRQAGPPEPEVEVEDAPLDIPLPLGGEPLTRGELEEWATNDPRSAALWAMQRDGLQQDLRDAVVRHWANTDPVAFYDWRAEQQMATFQQQLASQLAPQMQFVAQQQQEAFRQTLKSSIADWDQIGSEVLAAVQQNPQAIPPSVWQQGMPAVASFLDQFYGNAIRYARYQAQLAAQQAEQPPAGDAAPARAARAVTQASSGAAAPSSGGPVSEDDIKAAIVAGVQEITGGVRLG